MENKHIVPLTIPSYLVDFKQRLRPSNFMALAQESAMEAAGVLQFGFEDLAKHNLAWVVSRTKLVFEKIPMWKDRVEFHTWHKGVDGLYFIRDYQMLDKDGSILVNGTSSWITLNTQTRSLFRTDELAQWFDITPQCTDSALEENAGKIVVPKDSRLVTSHRVTYSDVDFIGHANNTSYIVWAMDCLPSELLRDNFPHIVEINFNKETRGGEVVDIFRKVKEDESSVVVLFEGRVEGITHFTARFTYKKI